MFPISRALAVHRRHEADLRAAGLPVCPENLRWWAHLPATERRFWTGRPDPIGGDDHHDQHNYGDGYPVAG
jgi:hypothetical protein